jgi:hypothetical protein
MTLLAASLAGALSIVVIVRIVALVWTALGLIRCK